MKEIETDSMVRQFAHQKFEALGVMIIFSIALINMAKGNWSVLLSAQAVPYYVIVLMAWSTWYGSLQAEAAIAFSGPYIKGYAIEAASSGLALFTCGVVIVTKMWFSEFSLWGKIGAIAFCVVIFLIKNRDVLNTAKWIKQEEHNGSIAPSDQSTDPSLFTFLRNIFKIGVWIYTIVYMFL